MKKKIRALFLESHYLDKQQNIRTHGVDYARVINPGKALMGHPDFEVEIRKDPTQGHAEKSWMEVTANWDVIYTSYIDSEWGFVHLAVHAQHNGTPFICDVDDNLWEIPKFSPTYEVFNPESKSLHDVSIGLQNAPYLTTTSQFLKYKLVKYLNRKHEDITVFPNYIDLNLYDRKNVKDNTRKDQIQITFYGTNTHTKDMFSPGFHDGLTRLLKEYPNVIFHTTGFWLPQLKTMFGKQYTFGWGEKQFEKWVPYWANLMSQSDIVVSPLIVSDFNKSKSGIKYLEYSAAAKPGVYQDIRQYQDLIDGMAKDEEKVGFLASTTEQWYVALKKLVEDASLRKRVGENAYNHIKENHTIQGHADDYANYLKWVINDYKGTKNLKEAGFILP